MNANINNQEISLHSVQDSFSEFELPAGTETILISELPKNATFVKIQANKDVCYLSNQNISAQNGFLLGANQCKIFSRREALKLKLFATETSSVKVQPLSHD